MEDLLDSLENLPDSDEKEIFNRESSTELNDSNEEPTISRLISQLTDEITDNTLPGQNVKETPNGIKLQDPLNVDEILGADEVSITPTCHNVSIINAACQNVLKQMEHQLLTLLKKNRKEQEIVQNYLSANCKSSFFETPKKSSLKCIGMPYFKDHYGFQQPPNEDVLRKQKCRKLLPIDFIKSFPVWKSSDAKKLRAAVQQFDVTKPSTIDWMKISVQDMDGKYSPSECKAKWMLHLNPSINKSKWSLKEMTLLKELAAKYNYQDWDKIAETLNTNRNGLQCCIQYQTHTGPTEGKWTKAEDESLLRLIEKYKIKDYIPWKKVAWHFGERSLRQCQERYAYHLGDIKKGNFTMEEDFVIVYLASKLKNFGEVAKLIPNRVSTQIRARYEYLVELSMPKFTKEEDELLTQLMIKYPRNWSKISENFKNRSRVQCRRRWAYLQRKIHLNIDPDNEDDEYGDSVPDNGEKNSDKSTLDGEYVRKNIPHVSIPAEKDKKYSEIYRKLLNYHKNCHKFLYGPKPRIPSNSEDLQTLTDKMRMTMKNLSVSNTSPLSGFSLDTLSKNCEFDKEDLAVLEALKTHEEEPRELEISRKIIPPNYMTLVGLRTFTLAWESIQNLTGSHIAVPSPSVSQTDPDERILCSDAKKLFKSRLKSIFAFPIILSNISPAAEDEKPVIKPKTRKKVKPLSKRKRKEHAKLMNAAYKNKLNALVGKFPDDTQLSQDIGLLESNKIKCEKSKLQNGKLKSSTHSEITEGNESSRTRKRSVENEQCAAPPKKRVTRNSRILHSA